MIVAVWCILPLLLPAHHHMSVTIRCMPLGLPSPRPPNMARMLLPIAPPELGGPLLPARGSCGGGVACCACCCCPHGAEPDACDDTDDGRLLVALGVVLPPAPAPCVPPAVSTSHTSLHTATRAGGASRRSLSASAYAVSPASVRRSGFAPAASSARATDANPLSTAKWSAVNPAPRGRFVVRCVWKGLNCWCVLARSSSGCAP